MSTLFEKELAHASIDNLFEVKNKLRFNNFAYSMRELSRHVLYWLAPDSEVIKCVWYKNETGEVDKLSRGERIQYAIQGGLSNDFVIKNGIDVNGAKKLVNDSINELSKYTHVNPSTFGINEVEVMKLSNKVIEAFSQFIETIQHCRKEIINQVENTISETVVEHVLSDIIHEVDELSTHHTIEDITCNESLVISIKCDKMIIKATGDLSVLQ